MKKIRQGCNSALDKKVATLEQDYAEIRPMDEEFAKLHAIAEAERTPEQHERHGLLLADLALSNQWTPLVFSLTDSEMNAAFTHHVKQ
jgi:hypothetical protein